MDCASQWNILHVIPTDTFSLTPVTDELRERHFFIETSYRLTYWKLISIGDVIHHIYYF